MRSLTTIEADLEAAFRREANGPIEIGRLLNEAKEQLDTHGEWLPLLKARFPHAVRTAQNYMGAARLAYKYATVAHLRLSHSALYALVEADNNGDDELVEAVLREAQATPAWIDRDRVNEIWREINLPDPPELPPPAGRRTRR